MKFDLTGIPERQSAYIVELVHACEKLFGKEAINQVLLFGSLANAHLHPAQSFENSDVDLIIIFSDSHVSHHQIHQREDIFKAIEIKYELAKYPYSIVSKILRVVEKTTGMYTSHFLCLQSDWDKRNFSKIFSTYRIFTKILAPINLVLDSVKSNTFTIYKNGVLDASSHGKNTSYSSLEVLKSTIMNLILYFGGITMLPFGPHNFRYILESYKWSLRASYFIIFKKQDPLPKIVEFFKKEGIRPDTLKRLCHHRNSKKPSLLDWRFIIKVPGEIIKIHALGFRLPQK